ncbi:MAG TPA: zf-TFIIB domain-containing protein [Candidatus Saccharimonadales bacterium]
MQCPVCNVPLVMSDRQGVEIDYCPKCRGVWLDRGELDKIIERSTGGAMPMQPQQPYQQQTQPMQQHDDRQYRKDDHHDDHHDNKYSQQYPDQKKKKRESFLGDIFDF